jgi:hypothetical protein
MNRSLEKLIDIISYLPYMVTREIHSSFQVMEDLVLMSPADVLALYDGILHYDLNVWHEEVRQDYVDGTHYELFVHHATDNGEYVDYYTSEGWWARTGGGERFVREEFQLVYHYGVDQFIRDQPGRYSEWFIGNEIVPKN